MADITGAIFSMIALFIVAALGFLAAKLGYLNKSNQKSFSDLLFNITLPCTIIASVSSIDPASGGSLIVSAVVLAIVMYAVMSIACFIINVALRIPKEQRHLYIFIGTFVNVGFIGIAVTSSIYGESAAFLGSIFLSVFNFLFYSIGVNYTVLVSSEGSRPKFSIKQLINAPFVASIVAILLFVSGLALPSFIDQAVSMVGNATAPLAMMLVGYNLAAADMKSVFTEWRLYAFSVLRFFVVPALAFVVGRMFVADELVLGVFVLMLAMPTGAMAPVLCNIYHQDTLLPTKGVIITTLASFVLIPALIAFTALI